MLQEGENCRIAPTVYPWNRIIGTGETTNKAAADFEAKWKEGGLAEEMYTGPHWEGGIKPEKPKPPPKPATAPTPAVAGKAKPEPADAPPASQSDVSAEDPSPAKSHPPTSSTAVDAADSDTSPTTT